MHGIYIHMTWAAAIPSYLSGDRELSSLTEQLGTLDASVLTLIVPVSLGYPFCYIGKRNEAARALDLTPADYVAFIDQVAAHEDVGAICLQGYEPLLPDLFAYTQEVLLAGLLRKTSNVRTKITSLKNLKISACSAIKIWILKRKSSAKRNFSSFKAQFLIEWGSAIFDIADDVCAVLTGQTSILGRYHHVGSSVFSGMVGQTSQR